MPQPTSIALVLLTHAASLPDRLRAAWATFTSYAPPEATTMQGNDEAPSAQPEPQPEPVEATTASASPENAAAVEEPGRQYELVLAFDKHEAQVVEGHLDEMQRWMAAIDQPSWRAAPWRLKLKTFLEAAAHGAMITSVCANDSTHLIRDAERVKRAIDLLVHEMNYGEMTPRRPRADPDMVH